MSIHLTSNDPLIGNEPQNSSELSKNGKIEGNDQKNIKNHQRKKLVYQNKFFGLELSKIVLIFLSAILITISYFITYSNDVGCPYLDSNNLSVL